MYICMYIYTRSEETPRKRKGAGASSLSIRIARRESCKGKKGPFYWPGKAPETLGNKCSSAPQA
jgi:hypothetical protein